MTKRLFVSLLGLIVLSCPVRAKADAADAKANDGVWAAQAAEMGGRPMPEAVFKAWRLTLGDGKYSLKGAEQPDEGTVKLYPDKKPKEMDITGTKGPNQGKTFLCIYEISGDTMKVCYDLSGKSRPTEFKTKPGTLLFLATYKRQKP